MRALYLSLIAVICLFFISSTKALAQSNSIYVKNACIVGETTLNKIDDIDGKPAYQGIGTVGSDNNVTISIYWMASDNVWVLDYDGQPYFSNASNSAVVPTSGTGTWTAVDGTSCTGSTPVSVTSETTLAVEMGNFSSKILNHSVILDWSTFSEQNNKGFYIERSSDGSTWDNIGFVQSKGNSTQTVVYQFSDATPLNEAYYRLRQENMDGTNVYSKSTYASFSPEKNYVVKNNPSNGYFQVYIPQGNNILVKVYSINGAVIYTKKTQSGNTNIDITNQPSGVYILRIQNNGFLFTTKLVKQ